MCAPLSGRVRPVEWSRKTHGRGWVHRQPAPGTYDWRTPTATGSASTTTAPTPSVAATHHPDRAALRSPPDLPGRGLDAGVRPDDRHRRTRPSWIDTRPRLGPADAPVRPGIGPADAPVRRGSDQPTRRFGGDRTSRRTGSTGIGPADAPARRGDRTGPRAGSAGSGRSTRRVGGDRTTDAPGRREGCDRCHDQSVGGARLARAGGRVGLLSHSQVDDSTGSHLSRPRPDASRCLAGMPRGRVADHSESRPPDTTGTARRRGKGLT